jgi:hypothetical protein
MSKKLIVTAGTEFEPTEADLALIEQTQRAGKPILIKSSDLNEGFGNAEQSVKDMLSFDLNGEELTVTPSTSEQVKTPDTAHGKNGFTKVTINAAPLETANATPTTSEQTITPTGEGKIGLSSVTIAAVTSAIDANIIAENIKSGVTILGVEGTYTGTSTNVH